MRKVQLLVSRSGPALSQIAGQIVPIEDHAEAQRMVDAGQCVYVDVEEQPIAPAPKKPEVKKAEPKKEEVK